MCPLHSEYPFRVYKIFSHPLNSASSAVFAFSLGFAPSRVCLSIPLICSCRFPISSSSKVVLLVISLVLSFSSIISLRVHLIYSQTNFYDFVPRNPGYSAAMAHSSCHHVFPRRVSFRCSAEQQAGSSSRLSHSF